MYVRWLFIKYYIYPPPEKKDKKKKSKKKKEKPEKKKEETNEEPKQKSDNFIKVFITIRALRVLSTCFPMSPPRSKKGFIQWAKAS